MPAPRCVSKLSALAILLCLASGSGTAWAENPSVAFDFARMIECPQVDSDEMSEVSGMKLVELKLRLSVRLLSGKIGDVEEIRVEISDCDEQIHVHDFAPATRLESQLSGDIAWTKTTETGKRWGASLGGEAPIVFSDVVAHVTPTINGSVSRREVVSETQQRLPPKQVVVVSGTIHQTHGVFFKLRPSGHSSLEGVHDLVVRFIVPKAWRGDSVKVCCSATGTQKILWLEQPSTWAQTCDSVALYLAGDRRAQEAAHRHTQRAVN